MYRYYNSMIDTYLMATFGIAFHTLEDYSQNIRWKYVLQFIHIINI